MNLDKKIPYLEVTSYADQHEFFIALQLIVNLLVSEANQRAAASKIITSNLGG
jgi:hypothetical protein